ncbi:hypothetical protein BAUCODRAFT_122004 [Baudoinia panamericana UAMH 10762]|uniref:C2H2-type domain-containing protein n=1 Tax=Baudoinia panamericana (strain UAMH 10762) TaxID=717646 RepID=M2NF28_BAUPA|nr:uncharacterized protein BAUCODRAFT_122004 [Baudoinia panamericana UAMH 10762]EMC97570.1 hypothetical protein BAUCODRAFT_122004 [Baudoinia panamericana UAMH 10762]
MTSTPAIRISQHRQYSSPPSYCSALGSASACPMGIPGAQEHVPPPLPPPSYIPDIASGHDPGWQWGNNPDDSDFGRPAVVKPGSSLLGEGMGLYRQEREKDGSVTATGGQARRGSSISTVTAGRDVDMIDEGMIPSDEDRPSPNYSLQSERQLERRTLDASSNDYDKRLLSRIGGPNTPKRSSVSYSGAEAAQIAQAAHDRRNSILRPLSLPDGRQAPSLSVGSPVGSRWPSSAAVSPGSNTFWAEQGAYENGRPSISRHGSLAFDDSVSHRNSIDQSMFLNEELMEDAPMMSLNIHDRSPSGSDDMDSRAGTKRRAPSSPREGERGERSSVSSASGQNDLYHRRSIQQLPNRDSPVSRFHPNHSSVSSASSHGPRQGSLGSSLGLASIPSSATSYGSSDRLSPNPVSPPADPGFRLGTPYATASAKPTPTTHQRTVSESTQGDGRTSPSDSMSHSRTGSLTQLPAGFMCECCPKKPKKFDNQEELRLHEAEKQYTCAYCPNRFKNKNEAERHQNSLHLRRHSWCCAALSGPEAAFHPSQNSSGTDTCGYCGDEFSNPPQWDIRAEHLSHKHKFQECNQAKKFFRADHFRQHLKHSHVGTSGKWTNQLENACMQDEPPPEKRASPVTVDGFGSQAPPALMVATSGLGMNPRSSRNTLAETPMDS